MSDDDQRGEDDAWGAPGVPRTPVMLRELTAASAGVARAAEHGPTFLNAAEKREAFQVLAELEARVDGLRMRLLAASGDVATEAGGQDISAWASLELHQARPVARAESRLARALDGRWHRVAEALDQGRVNLAQATVIVTALDDLPEGIEPEILAKAEIRLLAHADQFGPRQLTILGRRILEQVDPARFEVEEAKRLQALEANAERATRLGFRRRGDGTTDLRGTLPDAAVHRLVTYLDSFTQPRQQQLEADSGVPVSAARNAHLRGVALGELLERLDPASLPRHGGDATTVVVTIRLEDLLRDLGTADLSSVGHGFDGVKVTAHQARRLACAAGLIPIVLGGESQPLDLGRRSRLYSPAQRKAIRLRDGGCRAEGCDVPMAWTDVHHLEPWSDGGGTDLDNGISLCGHHHRVVHDPNVDHTRLANGDLRFHRRT
ncbi:MAG: DUF222 domain-containing protein [Nocardioides sp.]|uniref:HNH endonuclease signature motif containing protein n=1 Tax=Nocardioides sp. TaxID=35761 RepID=UPI0039E22C89